MHPRFRSHGLRIVALSTPKLPTSASLSLTRSLALSLSLSLYICIYIYISLSVTTFALSFRCPPSHVSFAPSLSSGEDAREQAWKDISIIAVAWLQSSERISYTTIYYVYCAPSKCTPLPPQLRGRFRDAQGFDGFDGFRMFSGFWALLGLRLLFFIGPLVICLGFRVVRSLGIGFKPLSWEWSLGSAGMGHGTEMQMPAVDLSSGGEQARPQGGTPGHCRSTVKPTVAHPEVADATRGGLQHATEH